MRSRSRRSKAAPRSDVAETLDMEVDLTLSEDWIFEHLKTLNVKTPDRLGHEQLKVLVKHVTHALRHLLGQRLDEVYEEAQPVLLKALFFAKTGKSGNDRKDQPMATPLLGQFLVAINGFIKVRNETQLNDYLALEPPFNDHYVRMIGELKQAYPSGRDQQLEQKCEQALPAAKEGADGTPWTPFVKFMVQYLGYLRDVDADANQYLRTYELLSELQSRANNALNHASLGHLILLTVMANAKLVCRLAIGLDRHPELIAHLKTGQPGGEDGGPRETLPERAANILRGAFVTCLNDRASGIKDGRPDGKKKGIYIIANLCLKILFQCRKTRNATQIFENIYMHSPPLSAYPKAQRITYLYYLGRFWFQNNHFYRAQLALQQAYDESPTREDCARQRRHILIYLITSNLILGRFPSQVMLNRAEARGLADRFLPICIAIRQGNLSAFRKHLDLDGPHADWFLHFRILIQLRNRCEVLVWRSLVRKTWLLNGYTPDAGSKVTPTVNIYDLVTLFSYLERQAATRSEYTDPDFAGQGFDDDRESLLPDTTSIESILSSLIDQGLLGGFISHKQMKFAITGSARKGSILAAGFPQPWEVMRARAERDKAGLEMEVPGWKKQQAQQSALGGGFSALGGLKPGPGMVVNLSGARPVGAVG